jgi:hypothetical protein
MPYNLLLLPLLGGFLFVRYWNPTRYHALRAEKERLLILAALAGLASLILAFFIATALGALIPCRPTLPCIPSWWSKNIPFDYSGTALLAFALGATSWYPLNFKFSRNAAIDRVIEEDKVPFELLLKKAQDKAKTVSVTMKNGKVYVGFVIHAFHPAQPTRFIQILPTKSGYRNDTTMWLEFTTFYSEVLDKVGRDYDSKLEQLDEMTAKLEKARLEQVRNKTQSTSEKIGHLAGVIIAIHEELDLLGAVADDLSIVLPVSEIVSINIYSAYIHAEYFPPRSNT